MPANVLIFGDRLISDKYQRAVADNPERAEEITVCQNIILPITDDKPKVAYVDLEQVEFCQPKFLLQLKSSFDKLRIVGIANANNEDKTIEIAKLGVSEVLTTDEYEGRISEFLNNLPNDKASVKKPSDKLDLSAIIGNSKRISEIKAMIDHLSAVDYPNAIMFGETGTGKDLLAKVMHYTGVRRDCNFIEVNCSAIPDELFESELFGHKKGAFTDAKSDKTGLFEYANHGTIFLDEIGNLSLSAQAKLLMILENRKLRRLGDVADKEINVRVLAATNVDLDNAVNQGRFREDLLYRLNLIAIHLPSLRERKEDIAELASACLEFYRVLYNKPKLKLIDDAIKKLMTHHWPGNVRELRNVIERSVLLSTSKTITANQIESAIQNGRITISDRRSITIDIPENGKTLKEIEKQVVAEILNLTNWNRSEASRILGISRARLRRLMEDNELVENRRK
ncbi:MAG: sigma-54 dependent transcriptional regulator [Candidatus Zixiibacteriota bacterium]